MNPHRCKHCQRFLLDFCGSTPEDPLVNQYVRIDCKSNVSNTLPRATITGAGSGKCAFLDFLAEAATSDGVRVGSVPNKQRLHFGPYKQAILFHLIADSGDPAAKHITARPINIQTSSERTFTLARKWLGSCLDSHEDCRLEGLNPPDFRPTRVIEIQKSHPSWHVRLFRPTTPIDYVALSYCWGGPQTMLTTKTQKGWETALPWEELSQTIKDAVYVCAKLGSRYLWVDALCILQDDAGDKTVEIAAMTHVYGAATLTLAASHAAAATEGFLQGRKFTDHPNHVFELRTRCPDGQLGTVTLFRPPPDTHLDAEPLDTRGWTLQERHLSRRVLEFKQLQLRWACPTIPLHDGLIDGWYNTFEDALAQAEVDDDALTTWMKMVYGYTLRKLTVSTDRILAISGIAGFLGRFIEGRYWAGLWESDIAQCLMWKAAHLESGTKAAAPAPRPAEYQGPSWSWVAVNTIAHYDILPGEAFDARVDVVGCDIELVDDRAAYGAVKTARLHLRGRTKRAMLRYSPGLVDIFKSKWTLDAGLNEGLAYARVDALEPEFASQTPTAVPVHLLEVIRRVKMINDKVGDAVSEGLILKLLPSQQYCRLGTFAFYIDARPALGLPQHTWFDECDEEPLCLI